MYIQVRTLAQLLRCDVRYFDPARRKDLRLEVVKLGQTPHFLVEEVDAWLTGLPRSDDFEATVTVNTLRRGAVKLRSAAEAKELLLPNGTSRERKTLFTDLYRKGVLPYLILCDDSTRRFDLRHLLALRHQRGVEAESLIPYSRLPHLVGASWRSASFSAHAGRLEVVGQHANLKVTRSSLIQLLVEVLPRIKGKLIITPQEWLARREDSDLPLMSVAEVAAMLAMSERQVRRLLVAGDILYMSAISCNDFLILPESVHRYLLRTPPLTAEHIAGVFGARLSEYWQWVRDGSLCCPVHEHPLPGTLYRHCLMEVIRPLCGPAIKPIAWLNKCLDLHWAVWTESAAARYLRCSVDDVKVCLADSGAYISTPSGERAYHANVLKETFGRAFEAVSRPT